MKQFHINSTASIPLDGFCTQCMMFFNTRPSVVLLFEGWKISSIAVLVGSCIGVFMLSILSECLRFMRSKLQVNVSSQPLPNTTSSQDITDINQSSDEMNYGSNVTLERQPSASRKQRKNSPFSTQHVLRVALHVSQLLLGYVLMLIVMTYNVWLGISVVLGLGTGYFLCHNKNISVVDSQANTSIQLSIIE